MNGTSTLHIPAKLEALDALRRFVEKGATALGADPDALYDLVLATHEAAANTVVHGYQGRPGTIEVDVARQGDALVVRLRDQARPFDPTNLPPPDLDLPLEQRPVGGMGIYMMRQLVDQVIHQLTPQGGNELTLVKRGVFQPHQAG
jgi:serine/threonine-protein kinase RsbW